MTVVGALSPPPHRGGLSILDFECVWCHRRIEVERAGWPYIHSVALLHFHDCKERPPNTTRETIEANAVRIADAIEKEFRGQ